MQMNHLKKAILFFVFGITVLFCGMGMGTTSHAYTEEEKAAAKAWLSAHGYSPDAGGASQAYQDYLDGKFDEELGITTEEASTQTSEGESATGTESAKKKDTEGKNEQEKNEQGNNEADSTAASGNKVEAQNTEDSENASTEEGQSVSSENTEEQKVDEKQNVPEEESKEPEQKQQITLYQKEKKDTYLEAVMVVLFSIVLLVVIKGILMLIK